MTIPCAHSSPVEAPDPRPARLTLRLLAARRYRLGRGTVRAGLWALVPDGGDPPTAYAISLAGRSGRRLCLCGQDREAAAELLFRLVRGRAAPCSLPEIIEDEMEIFS